MYVELTAYDHVGLRVTNRERALLFYERLGLRLDERFSNECVAELVSDAGVRINLVFNGESRPNNVLLDEPRRWPGYTHAAFVVPDLSAVLAWAVAENVKVTEGPVDWGRRITCFVRDPDGNVLEFNELR